MSFKREIMYELRKISGTESCLKLMKVFLIASAKLAEYGSPRARATNLNHSVSRGTVILRYLRYLKQVKSCRLRCQRQRSYSHFCWRLKLYLTRLQRPLEYPKRQDLLSFASFHPQSGVGSMHGNFSRQMKYKLQ